MERMTSKKKYKFPIHLFYSLTQGLPSRALLALPYNDSKMHSHNPDVRIRFLDRMRSPGKKIFKINKLCLF
jgi:hypothetical protein